MKKLSLILIVLNLALLFSGCGNEPNQTFLVSALYFQNKNGNTKATAEYISVSDTDLESGYTAKTVSSEGKSVETAVNRLSGELPKKLFFEHCATILLDKNLTELQTKEVFEFLKKGDISFSALLACAENEKVLTAKADSNPSIGFALSTFLKNKAEIFGFGGHIRVYEIVTARKQENNIFALPVVTLKDEKLFSEEMMLYLDDRAKLKLNTKESVYYAMARNVYQGGKIELGNRVKILSSTKLEEIKTENDTATFKINITNREILNDLNSFLNRMQNMGIDLLSKGEKINVNIVGGYED